LVTPTETKRFSRKTKKSLWLLVPYMHGLRHPLAGEPATQAPPLQFIITGNGQEQKNTTDKKNYYYIKV
jgi:hypothetical protein